MRRIVCFAATACVHASGAAVGDASWTDVLLEDFEFDFAGCSRLLRRLDWNQNVSDSAFDARLLRAATCMKHSERLSREAGEGRPAAMSGLHIPTVIAPTETPDLPHLPPLYFVLPAWDMVVSNRVRVSGSYDPQELQALTRLAEPGSAFVDVGANVGAVAVPLAAHVGLNGIVYAFEPFRQLFQYLNANAAVNGLSNVHTHNCALSDAEAPPAVDVPAPSLLAGQNAGMHGVFQEASLEPTVRVSETRERMEEVVVRTLDSFHLPRADVIKIDVEGHAPRVLSGAYETLRRHRPAIWFEHSGAEPPEVLARPELRYRCAKLQDATEETFLCVPEERRDEMWRRLRMA